MADSDRTSDNILAVFSAKVAARHLEARVSRDGASELSPNARRRVNSSLEKIGMDGNRRFRTPGQALSLIGEKLRDFMIEFAEPITASDVAAPKGRLSLAIATINPMSPEGPVLIRNSALAFHWTTLEDGVEVVAYLG